MRKYVLLMLIAIVLCGNISIVSAKFCYGNPINVCVWSKADTTNYEYGPTYTVEPGGSIPLPFYIENRGSSAIGVKTMASLDTYPVYPAVWGTPVGHYILFNYREVPAGETGSFDDVALQVPSDLPYGEYRL